MAYSTEHRRRKRSGAGGSRPGEDFVFAWKASKFITHWKRLSANSVNSLELHGRSPVVARHKAGPVLFQLPPNFKADADRLTSFLQAAAENGAIASNSGIRAGMRRELCACCRSENIALCISDHHDAPAPWKRTAGLRLCAGHGPSGRYKGHYQRRTLAEWAAVSGHGRGKAATCLSISTTTRRAPRLPMPDPCVS